MIHFILYLANEVTNPTYPQLRVIDGIDPLDRAIDLALSGGVTTSLVLPGSANVMGGEGAPIKLRGHTVGEMLIPNAPRSLKVSFFFFFKLTLSFYLDGMW